jgi:hypothetical protein
MNLDPADHKPYLDIMAEHGITVKFMHYVYAGPLRIPTRRFQADGVPFDLSIGLTPSAVIRIVAETLETTDRRTK